MNGDIQTLSHEPLELKSELPAGLTGLPGGTVLSASGAFGSLCMQYYTGKNYHIGYSVLDILQRFILTCRIKKKGLFTRIVLQNTIKHTINDDKENSIREGQFSMLHATNPHAIMVFEKPETYVHFDAYFSPGMVKEILPLFPEAEKLFNKDIITEPRRADAQTRELINTILHCRYEDQLRRHFFESRVKDLLFRLLLQLSEKDYEGEQLTERETEAAYAAEKIISSDLSKHFRIPELSRKVHLNEFRFKIVFKKIFGKGAYEYLQHQRMLRAKEMLEAGESVKVVAAETGYRITHFITAFREHFGFTPGSIKRNKH